MLRGHGTRRRDRQREGAVLSMAPLQVRKEELAIEESLAAVHTLECECHVPCTL